MNQIRRFGSLAAVVVLSLVLASCGLGSDDEDPTPTQTPEQASLNAEPTSTEQPSTPDDPFVLVTSTPEDNDSTPDVPVATGPGATIVTDEESPEVASPSTDGENGVGQDDLAASPEGDPEMTATSVDDATPEADESSEDDTPAATSEALVGTGSDGTSGPAVTTVDDATPAADPEESAETNVNAIEVESCDVVEVPPYAGSETAFVTTEDVNFRIGPGSDCESVLDGPLGPDVAVEVIGGPVVRSDDEESILWVQVVVGEDTGWIAQDFLEAVEPE